MQTAVFDGGFADPVFDAQTVFRSVMDAFSMPGTAVNLGRRAAGPSPLSPAASAILLTLADYDTPVWFEASEHSHDASAWLTFQTGAPISSAADKASFVVLLHGSDTARWADFARGTMDYPDRSATLLLPVSSLTQGQPLHLAGPGIETTHRIAPDGLPHGFLAAMTANAALYPLGFDLVLVCDEDALCLPRTTRIREA